MIWSTVFEKHRRLILSSGMIGCRGRLQREGSGYFNSVPGTDITASSCAPSGVTEQA